MKYRKFGRTGWNVSEIGFGAWAIGGSWGQVPRKEAIDALHAAIEKGVNFIDTADVYGDGRSEKLIAEVLKDHSERIFVVTKAGRRLDPHTAEGYNCENLTRFVERSLRNLDVDSLDLVQLHCPPTEVYYEPEVFETLDELIAQGKIRHYGVSVEKVEEALKAIEYRGVQSVQIIFNIFRQRPAGLFFREAAKRQTAVLARVPLASGLLTGKMSISSEFPENDHRNFNRHGQAFDVGETFSGVNYETGLEAVDRLLPLVSEGTTLAQFALRWILMFDTVSSVIPGAKNRKQAIENAVASELPPLSNSALAKTKQVYDDLIRKEVHHRW